MKQKALIVESARFFQNMIKTILNGAGVECCVYSTGKEALEAAHDEYTFILVARKLEDISGEIFLQHYAVKHGLGEALTIILTSSEVKGVMHDANKAGYKLVFNKKILNRCKVLLLEYLILERLAWRPMFFLLKALRALLIWLLVYLMRTKQQFII